MWHVSSVDTVVNSRGTTLGKQRGNQRKKLDSITNTISVKDEDWLTIQNLNTSQITVLKKFKQSWCVFKFPHFNQINRTKVWEPSTQMLRCLTSCLDKTTVGLYSPVWSLWTNISKWLRRSSKSLWKWKTLCGLLSQIPVNCMKNTFS